MKKVGGYARNTQGITQYYLNKTLGFDIETLKQGKETLIKN
jgi:hypothetical protein